MIQERLKTNIPATLENKREYDETIIQDLQDWDLVSDLTTDEFASFFVDASAKPKLLMTTSHHPSLSGYSCLCCRPSQRLPRLDLPTSWTYIPIAPKTRLWSRRKRIHRHARHQRRKGSQENRCDNPDTSSFRSVLPLQRIQCSDLSEYCWPWECDKSFARVDFEQFYN
jgi:hypothetical protein